MSDHPSTLLIVGATGSIGRYAVAEALQQGYPVRALRKPQSRGLKVAARNALSSDRLRRRATAPSAERTLERPAA